MRIGGIVLCGGRSSRMGQPKAWLPFGQELLLERIVRVVHDAVTPVVVVAAPDQAIPPLPDDIQIARDDVEGCGPLAGLASGLAALQNSCDAAFLASCDVPFLTSHVVERIVTSLDAASIAVPIIDGIPHMLSGVYRIDMLPMIRERLTANRLRMRDLLDLVSTRMIESRDLFDIDPDMLAFRNLNTPDDYAQALRILEGRGDTHSYNSDLTTDP